MVIRGHKGNEYEIERGWFVADKEGRSGIVVSISDVIAEGSVGGIQYLLGEREIVVDPGFGVMYTLRESQVTYTAPPEGDVE